MKNFFFFIGLLLSLGVEARSYDQSSSSEMHQGINCLRYELENHENELTTLYDRLKSQESVVQGFHQDLVEAQNQQRDFLNHQRTTLDKLELTSETLYSDFQKLKNYSNQLAESLSQLESTQVQQARSLKRMESALRTLMDGLDISEPSSSASYTVKKGDNLDKIARAHKTTIKKLKEENHLKKDQIRIGQVLKIP